MSYTVKKMRACSKCGELTNRRQRDTRKPLCLACNIDVVTDVVLQMRSKAGPHYEKWKESMKRAFAE